MLRTLLNTALPPLSAAVIARSVSIPVEEIDVLIVAVMVAIVLANSSEAADGYACLLAGRRRADEARRASEPWAEELLARYRQVMTNYAGRYGIALD